MIRNEEKIRDFLSDNLNFIDKGLKLIKKEYMLENNYGTKGFVDILAKDEYNNFVIIEIKKSNQAARQAIHEIVKYASLLKHNYKIKDSEIRMIIISTNWEELIIPYSELTQQTSYFLEGYQIEVDIDYIPISKMKIKPIDNPYPRNFSRAHYGFFCEDNKTIKYLLEAIKKAGDYIQLKDYILIELQTSNSKYPYSFALYFVFASNSKKKYWELLAEIDNKLKKKIVKNVKRDIKNADDVIDDVELYYLEQEILYQTLEQIRRNADKAYYSHYFGETGNPESFINVLNDWGIKEIHRFGFLKDDIRLDDAQIKDEIAGINGSHREIFFGVFETKYKARYNEIKENLKYCLRFNKVWTRDIEKLLNEYEKENVRISISIFNPNNILQTLYISALTQGNALPYYEIIIDFVGSTTPITMVYTGVLYWTGLKVKFKNIVNKHFEKDETMILFDMTMHSIESKNESILKDLGLIYGSRNIKIEDNKLVEQSKDLNKNIFDFFYNNIEFMKSVIIFFNSNTNLRSVLQDRGELN